MDFFILIAAAAGLVWGVSFLLRGSLVGGCLATIIAGSCFGYTFWHAEGGVPVTVDRALIGVLAGMYLMRRRWGLTDPKPLGQAEWMLFAFLAVLAFSTFSHNWKASNGQAAAHLVFYWLLPALVYWIARQSPANDRTLRWMWTALAAFGFYLTYTALAEATGQLWAVFPRYIASPKSEYFGRARGPFLNPAAMGIYLTVCLAAALTFWSSLNRVAQLALLGFTLATLAGIYGTLTRSAWMGGALGLAVFVALSIPRPWRTMFLAVSIAGALTLLITSWDSLFSLKRDVQLDASASADSAELRPILAKVAWNMFRDRPLLGCGFGQYDREKMPYLADRSSNLPLQKTTPYVQHNAFLALLVETGLLGLGSYCLLLALWIRNAWRLWSSDNVSPIASRTGILFLSLIGAYLPNALFQDTNIIDGLNLLLFFMAGVVSGLVSPCISTPKPRAGHSEQRATQKRDLVMQSI
jgi:O-antigen ligase